MIQKLQWRLTLLFTGATSLVFLLLLCVALFYQLNWTDSQTDMAFRNQFADLRSRLELDTDISDSWLARMEAEGKYIIHIEENGRPLFFSGAWKPETDRGVLLERAREQALLEHVDLSRRPFSYSSQESSVFSVEGGRGDTYLGCAVVLSREQGVRGMILLLDTTGKKRARQWQCLLFLLLELLGSAALYLVSRRLVSRAVKPVEEYHRKQTEFVAAASHELRSPLAVMQACASAILNMPEQAGHMAELIQRECIRTGRMVKNLLLLASLDDMEGAKRKGKGKGRKGGEGGIHAKPEQEEVEADSLLLQLLEAYEPLCGSRRIRLCLKLPEEILPPAEGNPQWLYQILAIFLDNAIAYGCVEEEGGQKKSGIELTACCRGKQVVISVCDHGPGIPYAWKGRIFDRFSRMDPSRRDKEHFGLGLGVALSLAGRMGAELRVEDTAGGGSTFSIWLREKQGAVTRKGRA